jgi:hypothetical protein
MSATDDYTWKIPDNELRVLRGMIIDRDAAWRADPKWAEIIDAEIHKGIENIDPDTHTDIDEYLRHGGLPGNYRTWGFGPTKMEAAWKAYLEEHNVVPLTDSE